jgi:nitrite reductase/ring-hydroxylating ferredoxin subunit
MARNPLREPGSTRRALLAGAGAAGVAVVTGCGSSTSSAAAASTQTPGSAPSGGTPPSGGAGLSGGTPPSGDNPPSGGTPPSGGNPPPGGAPPSGGAGLSGGPQPGGTTAAAGTVLGAVSGVPVGGGEIFTAAKIVVTQPKAGEYKGFSAICTHMGCTVTKVANGTIDCPCHGSKYSITDGSVVAGPAPRPLPAKTLKVANGQITLG